MTEFLVLFIGLLVSMGSLFVHNYKAAVISIAIGLTPLALKAIYRLFKIAAAVRIKREIVALSSVLALMLAAAVVIETHGAILFRIYRPPFMIIQMTDIHAGYPGSQSGLSASSSSYWMSNAVNTIIANKSSWNVKMVIADGDIYQGNTNDGQFATAQLDILASGGIPSSTVTNYFYMLRSAGISVFPHPGNHDCDEAGSQIWWTNQFTPQFITNDPYFYTMRFAGDTRCIEYRASISGFNLGVIAYPWLGGESGYANDTQVQSNYWPYTQWIIGEMAAGSNYNWIVGAHFMVNRAGSLAFSNSVSYAHVGPGIEAWNDGLNTVPNLMNIVCGHTLQDPPKTLANYISSDGHVVPVVKYNTQASANGQWGTNDSSFACYTIDPNSMTVHCQTYDTVAGRFMTNGEWGALHDFTFNIKSTAN